MALSINTINMFCMHYRRAFPGSGITMDVLVKDQGKIVSCAKQALGSSSEELKEVARKVLSDISEGGVSANVSGSGTPSAGDADWAALSEAARAAGGPIAGAMVSKFRKENPAGTPTEAKTALAGKLGRAFWDAATKAGI